MRHGVKLNHLGRTSAHRKALLSNLACELIRHKRIITTLAKARALRVHIEPILTKAKTDTTHQRRIVFSYLQDKAAVKELFGTISEKIAARPGGYTRIIKLGTRMGDNAETALIELVDFNTLYGKETAAKETAAKRTRRSGSRKKASAAAPAKPAEAQEAPQPEAAAPQPEATPAEESKTDNPETETAG
jgi:large subunit ribosomal protein L17